MLYFWANGFLQSAKNTKDDTPFFNHSGAVLNAISFAKKPERLINLGLGGGEILSAVKKKYPEMTIEAVEIDPTVVKIARNEFLLPDSIQAYIGDARLFLQKSSDIYDVVILDCYTVPSPPPHLVTVEFYNILKSKMAHDGVLIINFYMGDIHLKSYLNTVAKVFPHIKTHGTPPGNTIAAASPSELKISGELFPEYKTVFSSYKFDPHHKVYTDIKSIGYY